ncbi:acetyltransferase [Saccharopolyspora sp. HNM0983]|uniref:Acetyltransferase n=1 Tax=Saccharopolyspora montiporae TaxID=2781240 RepID=A0A929FZ41_9PSEU|nr:acetyltransferase [Saccharopolyspora sp. HNM0983]
MGREVLDALFAVPVPADELVFVDDHVRNSHLHGVAVLRPEDVRGGRFIVAVGDPQLRRDLCARMVQQGASATAVVHPAATIAHDAVLAPGCLVLANAYVSTGTRLEAHSQVQYNATIGHDTSLGEFATVLPGANVAGSAALGADVLIGSGSSVLQGIEVGAATTVGAGAVVTKHHPPGRVLVGVPAR